MDSLMNFINLFCSFPFLNSNLNILRHFLVRGYYNYNMTGIGDEQPLQLTRFSNYHDVS